MPLLPYIINSFRGGISDENDKGISGSFKFGSNLDIHKRNDSITCGQRMLTVLDATRGMADYGGTTMTNLINVFVAGSDGSTYAFGATGSIFARTDEGNWTFVYQDENGAIKGAVEHEDENGNNYLYWATSTSIARKPFPGSNSAPDTGTMRWTDVTLEWKSEFILLSDWHPMKIAGGNLNIGNAELLAQLDFDGDFDPSITNIRPGNNITCLEERDDMVILGSDRTDEAEEAYLWSWIETATNYVEKKRIPAKGINTLIYGELPLCQAGDKGEIFYSDFTNTIPVGAIHGNGFCLPHASCIYNGLSMFGFSGSSHPGIWSYGRKAKNRSQILNYEYRLMNETGGGGSTSSIGAMITVNGVLLASWGNSAGSYGVDQVSTTTKADAYYDGLEFDGGKPFWKKHVNSIKLTMSPMPANTGVAVRFKGNNETDWRYAIQGSGATTFSYTDATETVFTIDKPTELLEVGVDLFPYLNTTPEVLSITTYLDDSGYEFN